MVLNKGLIYICVALGISLAGAATWGYVQTIKAKALTAQNATLTKDLEASQAHVAHLAEQALTKARTDAKQAKARAKAAQDVRAVLEEINKEDKDATEPRPTASAAQLERLRRLTDSANAGIRAASKLP